MKRILPFFLLFSFALLSRAQTYPQVDAPVSMNMSLPAELSGKGALNAKITLHYRAGGKHQLRNNEFTFELLDEKGDQIKQGLLFSVPSPELEIEGTDPIYSPKIEFNTTANHAPLAKGRHYRLLLVVTGYGIVPMANVRSFTITE